MKQIRVKAYRTNKTNRCRYQKLKRRFRIFISGALVGFHFTIMRGALYFYRITSFYLFRRIIVMELVKTERIPTGSTCYISSVVKLHRILQERHDGLVPIRLCKVDSLRLCLPTYRIKEAHSFARLREHRY